MHYNNDNATCHVFVGSSKEGLDLAYALQDNLSYDAELSVWSQGMFDLSKSALSSLEGNLGNFDFAIFVFSPDDLTKIRNADYHTARDNVVFELGLFIGRLGSARCFILAPEDVPDLHLPSDLLGIATATYKSHVVHQNDQARLGPAANSIRHNIRSLGPFGRRLLVANGGEDETPLSDPVKTGKHAKPTTPDVDWTDVSTMRKLRTALTIPIARTLLDMAAKAALANPTDGGEISFIDVYKGAGFSEAKSARASLGAFTKVIKREFGVTAWPVNPRYGYLGDAHYRMSREIAEAWLRSSD